MTSTPKNGAATHTDPSSHDVARLLEGRLHDPRRVLGVHAGGASDVIVRVYKPNAKRVVLVQLEAELTCVPGTGLFEWSGPGRALTIPYRIRWQAHDDSWHEEYDPYCFPLHIDASDLARFA